MTICTQCGRENRQDARYCDDCAAPLAGAAEPAREVRKTVTAVFCDVVGSTALGEQVDPEVLRSVLRRYFDEMREAVERHGGRVDKFIGDAVVGVFGVPLVHEDDALRAVRAAVEMRSGLAVLNASLQSHWGVALEARTGVCTGEIVAGADDEVLLGDVMNTAARLEQAAEPGEILIAAETYGLVRDAVIAEPVELTVKGKASPLRAWRLSGIERGAAGHRRRFDLALLGRARELRRLEDIFEQAVAESAPQLVTVIGEPGIGKSRLVAEFEDRLDAGTQPVVRRRGQCLAYGDGIGFWPLGEIAKAQLGVGEGDSEEEVRSRLAAGVEGMVDAPWLRARLAPLVGLPGEPAERDEVFTAWQRFFDEIAERTPLVLVIEDVHWADSSMLAFVEYLAEWSTSVPLLILCTARPELLERQRSWSGGLANSTVIALHPLGADDTLRLATALLAGRAESAEAAAALAARCAGNPLYAEEYASLLAERISARQDTLQMPDSVQALIAARIDTLPPERATLLQDAAVVGKVFWAGALSSIGSRDPAVVHADLHELGRKQLVRRSRTTTIPGEDECAFWHDLIHEVAYNQIPRGNRADTHRRTAQWIEQTAGDRLAERAELIAHHYTRAVALTRASGIGDPEPLRRDAVRFLCIAAEHAMGLDADHGSRLAQSGLELSEAHDPERARLLLLLGTCELQRGELDEARRLLREARAAAVAVADGDTLAEAYFQESEVAYFEGDGHALEPLFSEAIGILGSEPSAGLVNVLQHAGFLKLVRGDLEASTSLVNRALAVAERLGDGRAAPFALNFRGLLRVELGDRAGLDDLRESLATFRELGSSYVTMAMFHHGYGLRLWDGPAVAAPILAAAIEHAARTHNATYELMAEVEMAAQLEDAGSWEDLLRLVDAGLARANARGLINSATRLALRKARVLAQRGETDNAREAMGDALERSRRIVDVDPLANALIVAAFIELLDGNASQACSLLAELEPAMMMTETHTAEACRLLIACTAEPHAHRLVDRAPAAPPRLLHQLTSGRAALAEADGNRAAALELYRAATNGWRAYGNPLELAHALAGQARCLTALDRRADAAAASDEAAAVFGELGVRGLALHPVSAI